MKPIYYCVAQHTFELSAPEGIDIKKLLPTFEPFMLSTGDAGKPLFSLTFATQLPEFDNKQEITTFEWEGAQCTIYQILNGYEIKIIPGEGTISYGMLINKDFTRAVGKLHLIPSVDSFVANNYLMMLYAFATASHNTLMFHASVIRKENKGYLFLGKSGTGKSTHSGLWLKHISGSELLNDDNPIVRFYEDGRVTIYGSPWSGKTPCYKNEEVAAGAFVRIRQAPLNRITRESPARAFASLLPSCSCLKQNTNQYEQISQTIIEIAERIPVYQLECLPNAEAAVVCYETIHNNQK